MSVVTSTPVNPWLSPASPGRAYDIEADWVLMTTCNFRCAYCFFNDTDLGRKISTPADVETLATFFDNTGLTWNLHLTGGEPFHYPRFLDLCRLLTRRHLISVNTNADSPKVLEFARTISPDRVDFVNCGLHIQQRVERNRTEAFIRHVQALRHNGFDAFVTAVMAPEIMPVIAEVWDAFAAEGVPIWPKAFRGDYQGRRYPAAYSEEERNLFRELSRRAESVYRDQLTLRDEPPTINPVQDREIWLTGERDYRGAPCAAGREFVTIKPDGSIRACISGAPIGNAAEGWFTRGPGLKSCTSHFCPYYCEKYSALKGIAPQR